MGVIPCSCETKGKSCATAIWIVKADSRDRKVLFIQQVLKADGVTAVDGQHYSRDIFGLVGGQEQGGIADVGGFAQAAQGGTGKDLLFSFRVAVQRLRGHFGCDEPR